MSKRKKFVPAANALLFSGRELLWVILPVLVLILLVLPVWHASWEKIELPENFRLPYVNRDNYYLYSRCAALETARSRYLFLGDSAIWGMYAGNSGTIPAQLNRLLKERCCGNLAIDGLHPVAMRTLVGSFGGAVRGRTVLIYFNPLWVNSAKYDLSGEESFNVNHPDLLPQFGSIACYQAEFDKRIGILLDRYVRFFGWKRHLQNYFYSNEDFKNYLVKTGSANLFSPIRRTLRPEEKEHKGTTQNYSTRGIPVQHWEWVPLEKSRQWQALLDTVYILRGRGNRVLVMVGTINPGLLDGATLSGLKKLRLQAAADLKKEGIEFVMFPELPGEFYADASHLLESGYAQIADFLLKEKIIQ